MRFSVFAFSLFFILSTTYAHAVAPLIFTAVEGALIRTATGQFIKAPSKKALANFAVGLGVPVAVSYCQKHKEKCKDIVGDVADYLFDDTDDNNACIVKPIYSSRTSFYTHIAYHDDLQSAIDGSIEPLKDYGILSDIDTSEVTDIQKKFLSNIDKVKSKNHTSSSISDYLYPSVSYKMLRTDYRKGVSYSSSVQVGMHYKITCGQEKEQEKEQQAQKIINHIKENDVDYIINNYGDTINIQQYCSSHACDELTAEFGNEVMNNKNDYDIDKINKANCEVENNKIKSCENAKKNKEKDEEEDEQETEETEQDETEQSDTTNDDSDKINCEASEFHKKVCDFIDWYQDDTEFDDDTKVKVNDLSDDLQLKKDRVQFNAQCPPDKVFNMSYAGVNVSPTISYKSLCDGFIMLKPFIIGLSGITAILIIAGGRRG